MDLILAALKEAVENQAETASLVILKNKIVKTLEAYVLNVGIEKQEFEKRQQLLRFDSSNIDKTWIHSALSTATDLAYYMFVDSALSQKIKSLI